MTTTGIERTVTVFEPVAATVGAASPNLAPAW
jgi:hypothetical protein